MNSTLREKPLLGNWKDSAPSITGERLGRRCQAVRRLAKSSPTVCKKSKTAKGGPRKSHCGSIVGVVVKSPPPPLRSAQAGAAPYRVGPDLCSTALYLRFDNSDHRLGAVYAESPQFNRGARPEGIRQSA